MSVSPCGQDAWDAALLREQQATSLVRIARQRRLVLDDGHGPDFINIYWVDEVVLALIDRAIARGQSLTLVYPAPAGQVGVLLAAQLLLQQFVHGNRSFAVGVVTADTTAATRTWNSLQISTTGNLLTGLRLGKPLVNVATIRTVRERYRITEAKQHQLFAELADDHVRASVDHRLLAWREIEVELGPTAKAYRRGSRTPEEGGRNTFAVSIQTRTGVPCSPARTAHRQCRGARVFQLRVGTDR